MPAPGVNKLSLASARPREASRNDPLQAAENAAARGAVSEPGRESVADSRPEFGAASRVQRSLFGCTSKVHTGCRGSVAADHRHLGSCRSTRNGQRAAVFAANKNTDAGGRHRDITLRTLRSQRDLRGAGGGRRRPAPTINRLLRGRARPERPARAGAGRAWRQRQRPDRLGRRWAARKDPNRDLGHQLEYEQLFVLHPEGASLWMFHMGIDKPNSRSYQNGTGSSSIGRLSTPPPFRCRRTDAAGRRFSLFCGAAGRASRRSWG
jgi:hypothetical protein